MSEKKIEGVPWQLLSNGLHFLPFPSFDSKFSTGKSESFYYNWC